MGSFYMPPYGLISFYGNEEERQKQIQAQIEAYRKRERDQFDLTNPFNQPLIMEATEIVNGYALYPTSLPVFTESCYNETIDMWLNETNIHDLIRQKFTPFLGQRIINYLDSFNEFNEQCNSEMCSDWNKQDEHGKCFGGFWNFPEDSFERTNAYSLSGRKSILCLFKLPYPIPVLLKTIGIGCRNRQESVRYSNFLCEWLARKYQMLNQKPLPARIPYLVPEFDEKQYIYEGLTPIYKSYIVRGESDPSPHVKSCTMGTDNEWLVTATYTQITELKKNYAVFEVARQYQIED